MLTRTIFTAGERLISGVRRAAFNPGVILVARKEREEAASYRTMDNGSTKHTKRG